ncbi:MAG: transposase [Planctomycetaceae bacterium]
MSNSDSTRRRHTAEFKHQAVMLVTKQGLSLAEAARRLGIHSNLLRNWKRSLEKNGAPASPKQPSALEAENARLRAENERLRMEREILKKLPPGKNIPSYDIGVEMRDLS